MIKILKIWSKISTKIKSQKKKKEEDIGIISMILTIPIKLKKSQMLSIQKGLTRPMDLRYSKV